MSNILPNTAATEITKKLYLNEELGDINFIFESDEKIQKIAAHKAILAVLSPVFNSMFFGGMKEMGDVKIVDADIESFKEFLQFFYLNDVTLTMENIETVSRLADKYDILDCVNACATFLEGQLTLENICWGYQLAVFLKNEALIEFCADRISKSPKEVFASEAFQRCDKETLKHILELNLTCTETDIFSACLNWAKCACRQNGFDEYKLENLKDQLGICLNSIRFDTMKIEEFTTLYVSYKGLFTPEEFEDIMLNLTVKEYEPKIFKPNSRQYIWNRDRILYCRRKCVSGTHSRTVQTPEKIAFTSNYPVLLGEICTFTTSSGSYSYDMSHNIVTVTVIELQNHTFHSNAVKKILFEGETKNWINNQINFVLPQPILIKPQVLYEIRLYLACYGNFTASVLKPNVDMDNGVSIHFHRHPALDYDNSIYSWISHLALNRI